MRYYLYSSTGNTLGIDPYIGYFQIGDDGFCKRYIELNAGGIALRYTEERSADIYGQLPEGNWSDNDPEMSKKAYGVITPITEDLFETAWTSTRCTNENT